MFDTTVPPGSVQELRESFGRLREAGVLESFSIDLDGGGVLLEWSPPMLKLLLAGRQVVMEAGFQRLMAAGDPVAVRRWIDEEAARLPDE